MKIQFIHGRRTPDEEMKDWGFDGPLLRGVAGLHWTYGELSIFFYSVPQAAIAARITGWSNDKGESVVIKTANDLVVTSGADKAYYGDWDMADEENDFDRFMNRATIWASERWAWSDLDEDTMIRYFADKVGPMAAVDMLAKKYDLIDPTTDIYMSHGLTNYGVRETLRKALKQ